MGEAQSKALLKLLKDMKEIKEKLSYLEESMDILIKIEIERQKK